MNNCGSGRGNGSRGSRLCRSAPVGSTRSNRAARLAILAGAIELIGCTGVIVSDNNGGASGTTPGNPGGGAIGNPGGGYPGVGTAGVGTGGTTGAGDSTAGLGGDGTSVPVPLNCDMIAPGRAPLRRLTTYEYNNTARDLLGDTTNPGTLLPAQVDSKQNLFGNDADEQSPSPLLIEKYQSVAESIANRATANAAALAKLNSCASSVTPTTEEACARTIASTLAMQAYRRTVDSSEVDDLVSLYRTIRALSTGTFASGVAAMIEAMLQSPDFLYRVELGEPMADNPAVNRIAGREMATRLSYLFWQTMPDASLFQAADAGMLDTKDGVLEEAKRLVEDPRSHPMVAFFFDNLLPIPDLGGLTRDPTKFPMWSSSIGVKMRSEIQRLLEFEIYESSAQVDPMFKPGSWPEILTSPYTFVDQTLYSYYGASAFAPGTPPVTGTTLTKVDLNTSQRRGLLTLGGMAAGSTISTMTNPVLRGSFILNKLMCENIELPVGFTPKVPDPYSGKTARERFLAHASTPYCAQCHDKLDAVGFPFENYDPVGLYRAAEHWVDPQTNIAYDTPIDASGSVPHVNGTAKNAVELVQLLATAPAVQNCFASHWIRFAYGRSLESADGCNQQSAQNAFQSSGYNIKQLLVALTQTDGFIYRPAPAQ
jgi:hypothetical protein